MNLKPEAKIRKVMHEFKAGELNTGRSKKKVKTRKQAIAIALSETTPVRQDAITETPVVDREVLDLVRAGLQQSVQNKITGITKCTVDDNGTFRGLFHQRITPTQVKSFEFTFGEKEVSFKPIEKNK